jgi:carboxyl-terminal processing protease
MNTKAIIPLLLLVGIGIFFSFRMTADRGSMNYAVEQAEVNIEPYEPQDNEKVSKNLAIQETVMRMIQEGHYSPKDINDDFSARVYKIYLEVIDFGKLFLLESDINEFEVYKLQIDDAINNGQTAFPEMVTARIKQRMKDAESYYKEALAKPFTFDGNDEIELDGKKMAWCKNPEELKSRWVTNMKFRTIQRLTEMQESQKTISEKKIKDKTDTLFSYSELESRSRANVQRSMESYFKRLNKINDDARFATYINAICHVIDPHTDFLPPKDKQRFDEEMSGSFFGVGAQLSEKNGVCSITQIITGSPCWKDGRLKNGDIIQKVAQADDEPVDIAGWDLEDIVSIIRGKEGSTVNLTVKHLDGSTEVIGIKRGRVETEATFAKSVIVETDAGKIGYILLPEFYADFNTRGGRRCAIDMKKEIEKLKEEKVNGIIIDLRYNGGGSLSDVVDIGGFFIDKGPIVQVKSKGLAAQPLFDESSGTVYDGPLAILINQGSASASEILAAAMQDYNRAIVLGTTSFGKGTVQRIFPLEEYFKGDASLLPFGSVKLTLQKFYRINGGSTQLKGVTPDITLPDLYEQIDMGERKDSNSLAWDQVAKADYKPIKSNANFAALIANSKSRIDANSNFKLIKQNAARLKRQYDDNKYPLNEKLYVKKTEENKALNKKIEELDKSKKLLTIKNPKVDLPKINMDTVSVSKNEEWLKLLRKDPYISEASNVLLDWMKLSKGQTVGMIEDKRKN